MIIPVGTTDISIDVQIVDDLGIPVDGLIAATFPEIFYSKGTGADVTITPIDLAALTDAHTDGGLKGRGDGMYRLDLPDGVASTAAHRVILRAEDTGKRMIMSPIQVSGGTESDLLQSTTIASLTSQTVFVLTAGSADDDAYNQAMIVILDAVTAVQKSFGLVSDYVGSSRTVTLESAPKFTIAVGDTVKIIANVNKVTVTPITGTVGQRVDDVMIDTYIAESYTATIATYTIVDGERTVFDPSTITDWRVAIEYHPTQADVVTAIENADITTTTTTVSFVVSATVNAATNRGKLIPWSLRKVSNNQVYLKGFIRVGYAALKDT